MGAVFGGASSTIFGSSGAGNFLTRLTTGAAIVFMITSLTLTYGSSHSTTSTIMPESSVAPQVNDETLPSGPGAAADEGQGDVASGAAPADQAAAPEAAAPAPAPEAAAPEAAAPEADKPAGDAGAPSEPAAP